MPFDAFISYSSKDKMAADAACAMLERAGIRCWIAPRDIRPGGEYGAAIVDAIDQCRVLVLIFSANANVSGQIHREIERAASKNVPIIPVRIEEVVPTKSMEYFLGAIHWLDALTPPLEKHLQQLAETIKAILQAEGSARAPAADDAQGRAPSHALGESDRMTLRGAAVGRTGESERARTRTPARSIWAIGLAGVAMLGVAAFLYLTVIYPRQSDVAAPRIPGTVPLMLYWSAARGDNFTTASAEGQRDALAAGYVFARVEGYVLIQQAPGTVPLMLYWSAARRDNFTTASAEGQRHALAAGYAFARIEGYVFSQPTSGTVPLKLFWSAARGDNFTTATTEGERDALGSGYAFARVEGYVYPK